MTPVQIEKHINWAEGLLPPTESTDFDDDEIGVQVDENVADSLYGEVGEQVGYAKWMEK